MSEFEPLMLPLQQCLLTIELLYSVYVPITKLFYLLRSIHTLYECDEKITNAISIKYTQKYMNKSVKLQCNPSLQKKYLGPYRIVLEVTASENALSASFYCLYSTHLG